MQELDKELHNFLCTMFKSFGLNDMFCGILSYLYFEPDPVPMEEIARKTGYSLASISNTMKLLESTGMVQRMRIPKSKKVYFYIEKDLVKLNKQKFKFAHDAYIKPAKKFLPEIIQKYKKKAKDDHSKRKLKVIENYHRQLIRFGEVMDKMLLELEKISC